MKIFEAIEIRGMHLKNRIGMPPFLNMPAGEGFFSNDYTVKWFESRAKGGAGLVMTGTVMPVEPASQGINVLGVQGIGIYDDKFIPGFAKIARAVHAHGAKFGVQIGMGGPMTGIGPSMPPYPDEKDATDDLFIVLSGFKMPVVEMTIEQIEMIEDAIAKAAARAREAGVDCVELHCAHGGATLHCSFISPYYNHRKDKYGGSWENRLRFPVETIQKMRKAVGNDFPIFARVSADQLVGPKGITVEDTTNFIVPALEKAGADCIDVSQGDIIRSGQGINIPLYYPTGCFIHLAASVKRVTALPVIGVGAIFSIDLAEKYLQENKADIIYMGRQLTADPETPNKYLSGRKEDIRGCIGCLSACGPCAINYDMQNDPIPLTPAMKQKKVLVIGGGIGGMEAARVAALRGHKVTLIEKDAELGGMVAALAQAKLMFQFNNVVEYLGNQMRRLDIDVRVCKEANIADVEELKPDVIILATGASALIPEMLQGKPGIMSHKEALKNKSSMGQKVVVWGTFGAELAVSLAEDGKDVVLLTKTGEGAIGSDLPSLRRFYILRNLTDINVPRPTPETTRTSNLEVYTNTDLQEITPEGVKFINKDKEAEVIPFDTLIVSTRFGQLAKNDSLFETLQGKVSEVYKIGDCSDVKGIKEAIWSANEVARKI
jgi:2,4-dienoyl-CoA reductase-like NADH-dependent reductase (Old Yellow Enzyme family)/NADPH-dependent 2,4-dienoyl-CoA reductase/sulfur reductase-like enzyme